MHLSSRFESYVRVLSPAIEQSLREKANSSLIDLALAENRLIETELVELYSEVLSGNITAKSLAYPTVLGGEPFLLDAFAWFLNRYFDPCRQIEPEHVVAGPGATACLTALLASICDVGDAVIIPGMYWSGFDFHLPLKARVHIINPVLESDRGINATCELLTCLHNATEASKRDGRNVRAILLTNPQNPSGLLYSRYDLACVAQFCESRGLYLIVDEVYSLSPLRPGSPTEPDFVSVLSLDLQALDVDAARVLAVWCTSKDFGSSGVRMGCVVSQGNPKLRTSVKLQVTSEISSLAAVATAGLLTHQKLPMLVAKNKERLAAAYTTATAWLEKHKLPYLPAIYGLYIFARLAPHAQTWTDEDQMIRAVKQAGVLVNGGRAFHPSDRLKGWARIVVAVNPHTLAEALRRLERALGLT